ncbi:unnamed protein product, partial [Prorocentrum cordatum]
MRRLPAAARLSLQALVCLWSTRKSSAGSAPDALALLQGSLRVSRSGAAASAEAGAAGSAAAGAGARRAAEGTAAAGWDDAGSTIGDISPRMIDDESSLAESAAAVLAQRRQARERRALAAAAVTEAQAEVLATTVTGALNRVGASLDEHMPE